jgi:predicted NBD/HSP70 family sugar kinase
MRSSTTPGRVADVRRQNLALVLGSIQKSGQATRAQLAAETGLTKACVSSLMTDLLDAGLVQETGISRDGERGRPGTGVVLNPARGALGAEINVDYLSVGVLDFRGQLRFHQTLERYSSGSAPAEVLETLASMARQAAAAAAEEGIELLGGGLAVPGLVDADRGLVLTAPNLGWHNVDLAADLEGLLPGAQFGVRLSNEANSAALAELWYGQGACLEDYLYVSGEVGVGGGLVIGSKLYSGPQGHAGEIGHLVVHPDGPACACGGRGCLERFASQEAIFAGAGIDGGSTAGRMEQLLGALREGEPQATAAVEQAGRYLGIAVASTARLLNVSAAVLGGRYALLQPWIGPAMRRSLEDHAPGLIPGGGLAFSELKQPAALIGAAGCSIRSLLGRPYELIS